MQEFGPTVNYNNKFVNTWENQGKPFIAKENNLFSPSNEYKGKSQ